MHRSTRWANPHRAKRRTGRWLQRQRVADLVAAGAACAACHRLTPLEDAIRDHIVPLAEGGTDDDANTQMLCRMCSAAKSAAEAARGRARHAR